MFLFLKFNKLITEVDFEGTVVSFNFLRNTNKNKRFCGGLLSIVSLIGGIYFASYKGL